MDTAKVILFDVMGTLVYEPFWKDLPRALGMSLEEIMQHKHPTAWIDFEKGRLDEQSFLDSFFADGRSYDQTGLLRALKASYAFLEGSEQLLLDLHDAGAEMHLLSNYPVWYRYIEDKLTLSRFAKWSFVSCMMGVRKPDAEAYLIPARQLQRKPAELIFVDDRKVNCEAASALGIDAIRFEDSKQLRLALGKRGLL